jgi:hypothetical protein
MAPVSSFLATFALAYGFYGSLTAAHPGEAPKDIRSIMREMKRMSEVADYQRSVMDACWDSPHVQELQQRAAERRAAMVHELRAERDLVDSKTLLDVATN